MPDKVTANIVRQVPKIPYEESSHMALTSTLTATVFPQHILISAASAFHAKMTGSKMKSRKPKKEAQTPAFEQNIAPQRSYSDAPLFFFKEDEENGWLCQWYRSTFTDPETNRTFTCAEQWMMYHKAMDCGDLATAAEIMKTTSPRKQKALGSQAAEGFDEERWKKTRSAVVEKGNMLKFTQATNVASMAMDDVTEPVTLKDLLLATGDRELVEASSFDRVWGIGFKAEIAKNMPRERWGMNLLGKALMKVRDELRREAEAEVEVGVDVDPAVEETL